MTSLFRRAVGSRFVVEDVRAALVPWVVSRVVVILALATVRVAYDDFGRAPRPVQLAQGLFAWDAGLYRAIAEHGYTALPKATLRFFPLVPLLSRGLGIVLAGHTGVALIVIANLSALVFAALLHRLALRETGDADLAGRAAKFAVLFPPAVSLVLGYAEAMAMVLAVGMFLALRTRRWGTAALLGLLAGLCRPVGGLLVLPALVVVAQAWFAGGGSVIAWRVRLRQVAAVVAPAVGIAIFLLYAGIQFGDAMLPITVQNRATLRGGFEDPFSRIVRAFGDLVGPHFGSGFHIVWAIVFAGLLVVVARRLPASYTAYAAAALILGLSAHNLDSFERYCMSTFPFLLGVAFLTRRKQVERCALLLASAGLFGYSVLTFLGRWVP